MLVEGGNATHPTRIALTPIASSVDSRAANVVPQAITGAQTRRTTARRIATNPIERPTAKPRAA